ncbi:hypothetical protein GXW82_33460 [Streptacidiphilus sp. 4-A2]|nr:hypothetical protein [Streptacidiphilus sp. 4-A2]
MTNSGNSKPSYKFQVKAAANGKVGMEAQLFTLVDGDLVPYNDTAGSGSSITFEVNVTQISGGVIAVIAGGGLLVLLAGLRLYWKRRKDAALAPDGPSDGPAGGSADDSTDDPSGDSSGGTSAPETSEDGTPDPADQPPTSDAEGEEAADSGQPGGHDPENEVQSPV